MEIIDQDGEVIATILSDTSKAKVATQEIENMSTNQVEYIIDNSLRVKSGLNRYKWNMTMTGPWHKQKNKRYKNGPAAKPGQYSVRLTVDDRSYDQAFILDMDPRSIDNVSITDINQQIELQIKIRDLFSSARKLQDNLEKKKTKLNKKKDLSEEEKAHMLQIEASLKKLKTQEGIYMQPMLVDQISYLYSMLNETDQAPGKDAIERYEELMEEFEEFK